MTADRASMSDEAEAAWADLMERGRALMTTWPQQPEVQQALSLMPVDLVGKVFLAVAEKLFAHPDTWQKAQARLAEDYARLWQATLQAQQGEAMPVIAAPEPGDRRFKDEAWTGHPFFNGVKQYYLLTTRWLDSLIDEVEGLDAGTRRRAHFYLRQFTSAMAPTNFIATNPSAIRAAVDSGGESLRRGFAHFLDDLERGHGQLAVSLTNEQAFEVGVNLATTPGKVVYRNALMELIQYAPTTATVHRRPLLIVPPWINKYYVLDLQPKNSFLRWAVEQGHTVFILSWVNPNESLAGKRFDDYLIEGPLAALDAITEATGETRVNALGYCIGGTLLACTLAHMAARGDDRIATATYFTTLVDFAEPGELGVFIDPDQINRLDAQMAEKGYLDGRQMASVFSMLRENDLLWSAVVNTYLLGKDPPAFDLLYWNSDSTRMPAMMHSFYLREMYLNNRLKEPDALFIAGTPIDLRRIHVPSYILATREDHIAPWQSTYAATRLYAGPKRFVLAESGHIAGVINPPKAGKYGYLLNETLAETPAAWLAGAREVQGSWWWDWADWLAGDAGATDRVPARVPGEGALPALVDAPGDYVRIRYTD